MVRLEAFRHRISWALKEKTTIQVTHFLLFNGLDLVVNGYDLLTIPVPTNTHKPLYKLPSVDIREAVTKDLHSKYKKSKTQDQNKMSQLRSLLSGTPMRSRTPALKTLGSSLINKKV